MRISATDQGKADYLWALVLHRITRTRHLLPNQHVRLVALIPTAIRMESSLADWNLRQANVLHHGPHNGETRSLCREGVNSIRTVPHIAKKTFNGVRRTDIAVHDRWKRIKREEMCFVFTEAAHRFGIALAVFALKGRELSACLREGR